MTHDVSTLLFSQDGSFGYLSGGHNRFIGALLVTQRRRRATDCSYAAHELDVPGGGCFGDDEQTAPLPPANQYWHFWRESLGGYVLPADLGSMGMPKDTGLCSLQLAHVSGWMHPRATRELQVESSFT